MTDGVIWHPDGTTEVLPIPAGYQPQRVWPSEFRGDWIGGRMIEHSPFGKPWRLAGQAYRL